MQKYNFRKIEKNWPSFAKASEGKQARKYNFRKIEKRWQEVWDKEGFYRAEDFDKKPKKYIMIEFPYPTGDGLHVGHVRSYSALDALARKKRMEGFNVLYPIGWDAFGLPTENYAIKKGIHPSIVTKKNIAVFKRQLKSLGLSFDWSREINTTDPDYYKWTQWIFLQFFKHNLAYQKEMPINWCPKCKIGLANEEVIAGKCERCGTETERRNIKQWMLKITEYADRLIDDLGKVDYSEKIKTQQINWIGRSEGTDADFKITGLDKKIAVFTTRIDTLFGVTGLVIAPEHPLAEKLTTKENKKKVEMYLEKSRQKSDLEREENKEKTGVFTGSYCVNPANNEKAPIWIGDYVVAAYGGGAVMVVPAHDYRDYDFAKKYELEIREVVAGGDISKEAYVDDGVLVNSKQFTGLKSDEARRKITEWLKGKGLGKKTTQYKLRDWIFSRQHYWGEPLPVIHCGKCGAVPVSEKDLPVKLPFVKKYKPTKTGESPLAGIVEWVNVKCPKCKGPAKRETDTMPNWAGSSWYFLRYTDPENKKAFADFQKLKYWLPVDLYNGGMEHTTLHLLYSRFWHKFLYDLKLVPAPEPYQARRSHGVVLAEDGQKMSKSFGNVINPDDIVKKFGADTLRMYEMFMGPFEQAINWSNQGVVGVFRFLNRVFNLKSQIPCLPAGRSNLKSQINPKFENLLHKSIKKISEDLENMKFNTAVSQLMILTNEMEKQPAMDIENYKIFLKLLAPMAPHFAEEMWQKLGHEKSIFLEKWPKYDPQKIKEEIFELVIQINGRMRATISAPTGVREKEAMKLALSHERVKSFLSGKTPSKIIFIPGRLINIVI